MRIWDIKPKYLCDQHLLGEHRELHFLWDILKCEKIRLNDGKLIRKYCNKCGIKQIRTQTKGTCRQCGKILNGYFNHPETKRWIGFRGALWTRHLDLINEFYRRDFKHKSNLEYPREYKIGDRIQIIKNPRVFYDNVKIHDTGIIINISQNICMVIPEIKQLCRVVSNCNTCLKSCTRIVPFNCIDFSYKKPNFIHTVAEQKEILNNKNCVCKFDNIYNV